MTFEIRTFMFILIRFRKTAQRKQNNMLCVHNHIPFHVDDGRCNRPIFSDSSHLFKWFIFLFPFCMSFIYYKYFVALFSSYSTYSFRLFVCSFSTIEAHETMIKTKYNKIDINEYQRLVKFLFGLRRNEENSNFLY